MQRSETGFYFMDRAPLDALVFSASDEERKTKAETLSNCFKGSNHLVNAQIQFISANGSVLEERNIRRGRLPDEGGDVKYLEKQTHDLKNLYSSKNIYDTSAKIPGEIAREIAISALLDDHCETDLKATLKEELSET